MFEPVHGSAPDIAGEGVCNPVGALLSAGLMLEHLGLPDAAKDLQRAVEQVTAAGVRTRDVGGTATTDELTGAIIAALGTQQEDGT